MNCHLSNHTPLERDAGNILRELKRVRLFPLLKAGSQTFLGLGLGKKVSSRIKYLEVIL
jgi:hypothetical protein